MVSTRRRTHIDGTTESRVLLLSARRCCFCFHLDGDFGEKLGQLAHIDRDPSNGAEDNLAFLCMKHHSLYDSRTSQHKNYTIEELKAVRAALYDEVKKRDRCIWVLTLDGEFSDFNKARVEALARHLRSLLGDPHLTITRVDQGSVKIVIESSSESFHTMRNLLQSGRSPDVLGHRIVAIQQPTDSDVAKSHTEIRDIEKAERGVVRVVIADDAPLFRAGLRQILTAPPHIIKDVYGHDVGAGFEVVGEVGNGEEAIAVTRELTPDLLLLEPMMPGGMAALTAIVKQPSLVGCRILLLAAAIQRNKMVEAVRLGVHGIMLKDSTIETLFQGIDALMKEGHWIGASLVGDLMEAIGHLGSVPAPSKNLVMGLTPREREVMALVVAGRTSKEIAQQIAVSENTLKRHISNGLTKLRVRTPQDISLAALASLKTS